MQPANSIIEFWHDTIQIPQFLQVFKFNTLLFYIYLKHASQEKLEGSISKLLFIRIFRKCLFFEKNDIFLSPKVSDAVHIKKYRVEPQKISINFKICFLQNCCIAMLKSLQWFRKVSRVASNPQMNQNDYQTTFQEFGKWIFQLENSILWPFLKISQKCTCFGNFKSNRFFLC